MLETLIADNYLSVMGGGAAALFGTFIGRMSQKASERNALTVKLITEWESSAMYKTRNRAYNLVKKYPEIKYNQKEIYEDENSSELFAVLGFFRIIDISIDHKMANSKPILRCIEQTFLDWYESSFKTQMADVNWDVKYSVESLNKKLLKIKSNSR